MLSGLTVKVNPALRQALSMPEFISADVIAGFDSITPLPLSRTPRAPRPRARYSSNTPARNGKKWQQRGESAEFLAALAGHA